MGLSREKKENLVQSFKISRIWSDPLLRNLCSGSLFALTFIWAAVNFFGVDLGIIKTFLLLSLIFVVAMILIGLILFPVVLLIRNQKPFSIHRVKKGSED